MLDWFKEENWVVVECRRHSIKDGTTPEHIGPKGHDFARRVGEKQLRGKCFNTLASTDLFRTVQTLVAFAEGAGDITSMFVEKYTPFHLSYKQLKPFLNFWGQLPAHECLKASLQQRQNETLTVAKEMDSAIQAWLTDIYGGQGYLRPGTKMLMVGSTPVLELPLLVLTTRSPLPKHEQLSALSECQGYRLAWTGSEFLVDLVSPDLDPAQIRHQLNY